MTESESALAFYLTGFMLTLLIAYLASNSHHWKEKRNAARIALLSPAWPALIVYAAFIGLRMLWAAADWKGGRK